MSVLQRLPSSRFSEVLPEWRGQTVAIIGGGPSVTDSDVDLLCRAHDGGRLKCIAVNDAYLLAPWADVQYAADAQWHRWHTDGVARLTFSAAEVCVLWHAFAGEKCSIEHSDGAVVEYEDVHVLRNANYPNHGWGLSKNPRALVTGRNSGFQALNLAVLAGASRVLLLGFDGVPLDGKSHWFGEHPKATPQAAYALYAQAMSMAERELVETGVTVINCSVRSNIDTFSKVALKDVQV